MPRWLKVIVILAITLGVVLRFTNVSHKAYWLDEAFTSLHVSGYSDGEAMEQLVSGNVISNADLQRFQYPNDEKTALDSITHIALTAPELPPPYFLTLRGWTAVFGQSTTSLRLFSVAMSLLLLPAAYWLCCELFPGSWVGAITLALIAQSPFHLLYAQEARPYSLWTLLIVLSYAALLRALRRQTRSAWTVYGLTFAAGLYCHLLHGLVIIAQSAFIAWREWQPHGIRSWGRSLRQGTGRNFIGACLLGSLLFAPWILFALVNFSNFQTAEAGTIAPDLGLRPELIKGWVKGWNLMLVDFNLDESASRLPLLGLALLLGTNLVWMAIALYQFIRQGDRLSKQLLLSSIGTTAALLILPDFLIGGQRSSAFRYWLPAVLSMQLVMAFVLAAWLNQSSRQVLRRWGQIVLVGLLSMGLISNITMVMSWDWWSKDSANANLELPALVRDYQQQIAQQPDLQQPDLQQPDLQTSKPARTGDPPTPATGPLFVSDQFFAYALSTSHALPLNAQWLITDREQGILPHIPPDYSLFYLYAPSTALLAQMQSQYHVKAFNSEFWQVSRQPHPAEK